MATKASSQLLPCNDPARPDWSFLCSVLGRDEGSGPPANEAEAFHALRALLREAFEQRPNTLFCKAILGKSKGNMNGQINAFASQLRTDYDDGMMTVPKLQPHDMPAAEVMNTTDPAMLAAMHYIQRSWVNMRLDGKLPKAVKKEYIELGASSKQPIDAWMPSRAGVIPHLRGSTQSILLTYYTERQKRDRMQHVSLEKWQEDRHFDITIDGDFVQQEGHILDPEVHAAAGKYSAEFLKELVVDDAELLPREGEQSAETQKQLLDAHIEAVQGSPDWPLLMWSPGYQPGATPDKVRELVRKMLKKLRPYDSDLQADWDTITEVLSEWDGSVALKEAIPEFFDYAHRNRYFIAGIEKREPLTKVLQQSDFLWLAAMQNGDVATEEPNSVQHHTHVAQAAVSFQDMLTDADQPEADIKEPTRKDYLFLCERTGTAPGDPWGPALHKEMKRLLEIYLRPLEAQFARRSDKESADAKEFVRELFVKWNPADEFLGERLSRMAFAMVPEVAANMAVAGQSPEDPHEPQAAGLANDKTMRFEF